jgi:hypothetical protein
MLEKWTGINSIDVITLMTAAFCVGVLFTSIFMGMGGKKFKD